jgi:hypothetical protein
MPTKRWRDFLIRIQGNPLRKDVMVVGFIENEAALQKQNGMRVRPKASSA